MAFDIADIKGLTLTKHSSSLVSYCTGLAKKWEKERDRRYLRLWDEYYRIANGIYHRIDDAPTESKHKKVKAVMPALQQAVETTVAEEEEALFGRPRWVVFDADSDDDDPQVLAALNKKFLADAEESNVPADTTESLMNAATYGIGIGKVVMKTATEYVPTSLEGGITSLVPQEVIRVHCHPVSPYEFAIDPGARSIEEAHGMVHRCRVPLHSVYEKQNAGIYDPDIQVEAMSSDTMISYDELSGRPAPQGTNESDLVNILEYHGLVPAYYLPDTGVSEKDLDKLVEVIVTIANDQHLLRCVRNPFPMQDRSFVAFQQDRKPGEFYGRGVCSKGYWPQKVLDAEIRARIEALSYSTHPMTVTNSAMLVNRGAGFQVHAGKNIMVNGDPTQAIMPIKFPGPDPFTFQQAGDMERMVEMATGAVQAATSPSINARNNTATGISIMQGAAIKRSKRTLQNLERSYIRPMVRKMLLRYMQFAPERYPFRAYNFKVNSTMGIMAREFEQGQLTQLLQTAPPDSPAYWVLLNSIYENSSLSNKEQMQQVIQMQLQQLMNPQPPQPDLELQLEAKKHEDKMALEYEKLDNQDRNKSRDRKLKIAEGIATAAD